MTNVGKTTLAGALMIAVVGASSLAAVSTAAAADASKAQTEKAQTEKAQTEKAPLTPATLKALKTVDDAFDAMQSIHGARIAIFQGDPVNAARLVAEAAGALDKVKTDIGRNEADSKPASKDADKDKASDVARHDVVFDARMGVVEDFVGTPEKKALVEEANEHLKKGEHQKGLEKLKLADIVLNVSRYVMPLETTIKHVATANTLMAQHKYYEANLALKAAVDSVVVTTDELIEPTTKGAKKDADKKDATPKQ